MFEVPAGGRRYRALELLAKQKRLAKTAPVPCVVGDAASGILIDEVSLAENIDRAPLHPLDQFRAFQAMRDKGMTEEAIAAAFFVGVNVVKQRLRLASVSPKLLDVYADDGMTLEMLMAFTVSADHARQEQVWEAISAGWQKEPWQIRRMLTETTVRASDKRAVFVGLDAYEAAGGAVLRDLFQSDDGGWLQDVRAARPTGGREAQGGGRRDRRRRLEMGRGRAQSALWRDPRIAGDCRDGSRHHRAGTGRTGCPTGRIQPSVRGIRGRRRAAGGRRSAARRNRGGAGGNRQSTLPLRPRRNRHRRRLHHARRNGRLKIDRGYVRPEDEPPAEPAPVDDTESAAIASGQTPPPAVQRAVVTIGGQSAPVADDDEEDGVKPLPERLIIELTAHRTLALRDALANHPHVAMTALLHKLVSDTFLHRPATGALEANVRPVHFTVQAEDLKDSASAKSVNERHEHWGDRIPAGDEALWDWLAGLDDENRMALLAHCVSYGVNALYERPNPYGGSGVSEHGLKVRLAQADRLARATGLDMAQVGWRPTVGNYLGRVTKTRIVEAVREGAGERAAQLIDHMKKGDMAKEAERLLADTGWLPEPLRLAEVEGGAVAEAADDAGDDEALPAFLTEDGDEDDAAEADEEEPSMIAAE